MNEREGVVGDSYVRWAILSVTTLSSFMVAFDSNVVSIALPVISRELSAGISIVGWVISAYLIANAAFLLQLGKLADKYGRRKIYLAGLLLFGVTSAMCGFSGDIYQLLGFRVSQGLSGALLTATAAPLVFESFPHRQRGAALGVNSIAWGVGSIAGPVGGGLLTSLSWRFIFFINIPVAAAAFLLGRAVIPRAFNRRDAGQETKIEIVGSSLLAVTTVMTFLWLTFFDVRFALLGVFVLLLFVANERKSANPLLNRGLLGNKGFQYSLAVLIIGVVAGTPVSYLMSYYFQVVAGYSPTLAGIFLAPPAILLLLSAPLGGKLYDKLGSAAVPVMVGAALEGVVAILLSIAVGAKASVPYILLLEAVTGIANAFLWTPPLGSALRFAKAQVRGIANGTVFMVANIAFAASISISVAVSAWYLPRAVVSRIYLGNFSGIGIGDIQLFQQGIAGTILTLGLLNFLIIPIAYLLLRQRDSEEAGETAGPDSRAPSAPLPPAGSLISRRDNSQSM